MVRVAALPAAAGLEAAVAAAAALAAASSDVAAWLASLGCCWLAAGLLKHSFPC